VFIRQGTAVIGTNNFQGGGGGDWRGCGYSYSYGRVFASSLADFGRTRQKAVALTVFSYFFVAYRMVLSEKHFFSTEGF
jgi:hypothetical protein